MMMIRILISIFKMLPVILLSACTRMPNSIMGNGGHMMGYGYGGGFMWLFLLILIGVVVFFLYQGTTNKSNASSTNVDVETPLDILKRRYANGDIDKTEFEQMKKDLED